jgi:hypothetical protein
MRHKYNPQRVKRHLTYSAKDVSSLYGIHEKTVLRWISLEGLAPVEGTRNPYLIPGSVLRSFIEIGRKKSKAPLQPDEFYCLKCRTGRHSKPECVEVIRTGKKMGTNKFSGRKIGICEVCGRRINRLFTYTMDEPPNTI